MPASVMRPGEPIAAGDTFLHVDLVPPEEHPDDLFEQVRQEVAWSTMHHRGGQVPRLVAVQGDVAPDGSYPVYRHPADASPPLLPFSPTVRRLRAHAERVVGHPLNHALIQLYRSGADFISEHADKTVDVAPASHIVNVSLGAQRVMTLRTKKDAARAGDDGDDDEEEEGDAPAARQIQRVPLPHNSLLAMGLATNRAWTHAIRADKRPAALKAPAETAYAGARISLTFRRIHTFLAADARAIWGAGATGKTRADARPVVHGGAQADALLAAFGAENHSRAFDWARAYGAGFDVLHFCTDAERIAAVGGPPS